MPQGNGNKFKGNKAKKGKKRKNPYATFDEKFDQYAKVVNMQGGKHMTVQPLDNLNGCTVLAIIKGKHHRKVWYNKDELIVIRNIGKRDNNKDLYEVQGKVQVQENSAVRNKFDKLQGDEDNNYIFADDDEISDSDSSDDGIPPQPIPEFLDSDKSDTDTDINIDTI